MNFKYSERRGKQEDTCFCSTHRKPSHFKRKIKGALYDWRLSFSEHLASKSLPMFIEFPPARPWREAELIFHQKNTKPRLVYWTGTQPILSQSDAPTPVQPGNRRSPRSGVMENYMKWYQQRWQLPVTWGSSSSGGHGRVNIRFCQQHSETWGRVLKQRQRYLHKTVFAEWSGRDSGHDLSRCLALLIPAHFPNEIL